MVLTLYTLSASPPARAAMMTIEALNIPNVIYKDVNLLAGEHLSEEYRKLNPQHTIPLLQDDDFVIWDSHAISVYLITKYGKDDSLYPKDPQARAIIDQRLHFDSGILFPGVRGSLAPILFANETAFRPESLEKLKEAYQFTENFLTKKWIAGDNFTVADICCVASLSSAEAILPIDKKQFPKLSAWLARCSEISYFKKINAPGVQMLKDLINSKIPKQ